MTAYYNENDPFAAAWLRELIKKSLIAPGDVDERSIKEVQASDLKGFGQCHFFAGIGVWSYALKQAGWPEEEVWTGSCPCQPFSAAGKRSGITDERHLWPEFFRLIKERRPKHVFGEQVSSKDGLAWLDIVQTDLENEAYACGAVDICAAGFGAPHIRQRLYWVAGLDYPDSQRERSARNQERTANSGRPLEIGQLADDTGVGRGEERQDIGRVAPGDSTQGLSARLEPRSCASRLAHANDTKRRPSNSRRNDSDGQNSRRKEGSGNIERYNESCRLADSDGRHPGTEGLQRSGQHGQRTEDSIASLQSIRPGPVNGFWRNSDWLGCRDNKFRPVEPGTFPLVDGAPQRMGRLRGYGNALVASQAQAFVEAYIKTIDFNV